MAARITAYAVALIVGLTLIAGLIVGAQRDDDGPVDLIVINGRVYTPDGDGTMAEAVAVQGNKILRVGTTREVQRMRRPQTVVVDAKGGAVMPGFNDASLNFLSAGLTLSEIDLRGAETVAEIERTVRAWALQHPDREWIIGRGWSVDAFDGLLPTKQLLDAVVADRPAYLISEDGQTGWANTHALRAAGIARRSANPAHGVIVKDARSGEPTGVLTQAAMTLVSAVLPKPTRDDKKAAIRAAMTDAHRRGVTSVQSVVDSPAELELYDELRRAQDLGIRIYATLAAPPDVGGSDLDILAPLKVQYGDDPLFKAGAVRVAISMDGVTESHTMNVETLNRVVGELDRRGWQVTIHASGEGAGEAARDAIAYAARTNPVPARDRRHRIEQSWLHGMMIRSGDVVTLGSEGPARAGDPLLGIFVAVNGHSPETEPLITAPAPGERLTLRQAIDAYTRNAAWLSFDEHRKGTLERDMLADLVVLTRDIFALPSARMAEAEVAVTIFDGKVVYQRATETN
ncbi:MAG TPA: amidohydrolase [Vicinamibacterales bacterium]|nr:amidohydrolase [Vicinamibacterales bacterium]